MCCVGCCCPGRLLPLWFSWAWSVTQGGERVCVRVCVCACVCVCVCVFCRSSPVYSLASTRPSVHKILSLYLFSLPLNRASCSALQKHSDQLCSRESVCMSVC